MLSERIHKNIAPAPRINTPQTPSYSGTGLRDFDSYRPFYSILRSEQPGSLDKLGAHIMARDEKAAVVFAAENRILILKVVSGFADFLGVKEHDALCRIAHVWAEMHSIDEALVKDHFSNVLGRERARSVCDGVQIEGCWQTKANHFIEAFEIAHRIV